MLRTQAFPIVANLSEPGFLQDVQESQDSAGSKSNVIKLSGRKLFCSYLYSIGKNPDRGFISMENDVILGRHAGLPH